MSSIWQNNKILRKWERKNFKYIANGNFNYNLAHPLDDPLVNSLSNYLKVDKEYIYVGTGISQFINAIVGLNIFNKVYLPSIEFNLYKRTAAINDKEIVFIDGIYVNDIMDNLKNLKSSSKDLLCISSPRWFSGEVFSLKQIAEIVKLFKGTIVIDEAYIDYSDNPNGVLDLVLKNNRLILFRSFSKKFLASGFRTGYMITKKKIDGMRNTIIPPHSVTSYSENFFVRLLSDKKILKCFDTTTEYIKASRELIYKELKDTKEIVIIKSESNFITLIFKNKKVMNVVYDNLKELAGIQKFDEIIPFIKIWVNNEAFSKEIIKRVKEVL